VRSVSSAEGSDRPRNRRQAAEDVVHPPVEVEADHVLDVLPPPEESPAVPDLRVAADGAHRGVLERADEVPDRVRFEQRVAVDHDDDLVAGGGDTGVEGGRLAGVGLAQQPDPRVVHGGHDGGRPVGGPVVDDDDLQVGVVAPGQGADGAGDADLLVVGGDDDAHRGERRTRGGRPDEPHVPAGQQGHHEASDHGQDTDEDQEDGEEPGDRRRQVEGQQQGQALEPDRPPDRLHRRPRRQPGQTRHRREGVALALQLRDQPVDGLDGLMAVTAPVVEEDDPALAGRRCAAGDDGPRPRLAPVLRVLRGEDQEVAEAPGPAGGGQLGGGEVGDVRRVGEAQEVGADPGRPGQGALGEAQLDGGPGGRHRPQVGVGEGVGPDLVAGGQFGPDEFGMSGRLRPHDEEGGRDAVAAQDVEDLRRPLRVGAVVEGEGHRLVGQRRRAELRAGEVEDGAGGGEPGRRAAGRNRRRPADLVAGEAVDEEGQPERQHYGHECEPP